MNKFLIAEEQGRKILKSILDESPRVKDYKFSELRQEYDCEVETIDGDIHTLEVKYRPTTGSTHPLIVKEGVMIEKFKYDTIMSKNPNKRHWYIHFFSDEVGYIFDLNKFEPKWFTIKCPKYTVEESEDIVKIVANIPLKDGHRFTFDKSVLYS